MYYIQFFITTKNDIIKKKVSVVLMEAFVVGILLLGFYKIIEYILTKIGSNTKPNILLTVFLSGVVFHITCEYLGLNMWYSKNYCKLM